MKDKELKIFIAMSRTLNKLNRMNNQLFREYDLTTGQYAVLEALYHKGEKSVGEIQNLILSTTGNMTVIIKNLKARDLISSCSDEKDRRLTLLNLTEKGRNLISEVFPKNEKLIEEYYSILSESEKSQLLLILSKFK